MKFFGAVAKKNALKEISKHFESQYLDVQEVIFWLVNGVQPGYKWGIWGYNPLSRGEWPAGRVEITEMFFFRFF